MPTVIFTEVCPYCARPRSPLDLIRFSSFVICQGCYHRHNAALEALSTGKYTGECSECGKDIEEIRQLQGDGDTGVRMTLHYENGIYRPMCMSCDSTYVPKRRELYGATGFGRKNKL